ncbi:hydroxymethylglutaryl-CoA synthase [Coccomyxa subellipsoidea C-169]|uniref:Hydroxymethylglutaryl-CoA synthase n=1 Tax=Coccomyxa subellipsoidea (strain C-169) TaxID=574566 RepID=I0Z4X8_COCSC|nr:hydroxymethylglutaryl-CoA synthase [Coccomyxa subellipsoidea C-169]EIE25697.1 hydroxymethylglutaryl-CoA synthase [Coccomyxa subellipsoidea C-169]|eukprot:XP_005650241.1 hydroxymethylglutaryl-CoA synthase [Coccomyxa subellipsoidea C-169]
MALVERYHTQEAKQFINGQPDEPQRIDDEPVEAGQPVRKAVSLVQSEERAKHVGILALEVYFPNIYVSQDELEVHDKVAQGKYTLGLGQRCMAFCGDQEDVVSMSLTAVHSLLEKYDVDPKSIGRLEVGTESALDRSKSIKTFLMTLFAEHGNHDIEGVDSLNACYGGTAALFNAVNWVESRAWDGRLAIVVATDIAMYAAGPARPSGGCGAIAMLIGPDAPLDLERGLCASHMEHAYDFYKPCGFYPLVDGKSSVACYLIALDRCYASLCEKFERQRRRATLGNTCTQSNGSPPRFSLADADFCILHSPFVKMVRKGFARLVYQDHLRAKSRNQALQATRAGAASLDAYPADPDAFSPESYSDRGLERAATTASAEAFSRMVQPGLTAAAECGNMYAASVHAGLASLIEAEGTALEGRRVLMYSYGSGLAASLWSLIGRRIDGKFALGSVASKLDIQARLAARRRADPAEFVATLELQERRHGEAGYKPERPISDLRSGTYYLCEVDSLYRRTYARKS